MSRIDRVEDLPKPIGCLYQTSRADLVNGERQFVTHSVSLVVSEVSATPELSKRYYKAARSAAKIEIAGLGDEASLDDVLNNIFIPLPRAKLYRAWTEPELMKQWSAPAPWTTPVAETDVRQGGASHVVMRSPEGQDMRVSGVYLEVTENEKLVFTDAYTSAWVP